MHNMINVENCDTDLSGYTLIIPSVSVGNVPQLMVDLLIATYDFSKYSTIWHPALIPSVGSDPYSLNTSDIYTTCELYINEKLKLATIQLRSTVENRIAKQFFNNLREVLVFLKFKFIYILSSAFDYELHIFIEKFYYLSSTINNNNNAMENNCIKELQPNLNGKYYLNGGGFAVLLYNTVKQKLPCTLLVKYVSEGDNRPDAVMMLRKLFSVMEREEIPEKFKCPSSWKFVFGGPPPMGIY